MNMKCLSEAKDSTGKLKSALRISRPVPNSKPISYGERTRRRDEDYWVGDYESYGNTEDLTTPMEIW